MAALEHGWKSFDGTVGVHFWNNGRKFLFRALIFPVGFLWRMTVQIEQNRMIWLIGYGFVDASLYDKHNAAARRLIPEERLLVCNVKEGWEPLCAFLEVPVPQQPFPRLNEQESMKAIYFGMQMFGACIWVTYIALLGGLAYLALRLEPARALRSYVNRVTSKLFE